MTKMARGSSGPLLQHPGHPNLKIKYKMIGNSLGAFSFDFKLIYWPQVTTIGDIMIDIGDSNPKITDTLNR